MSDSARSGSSEQPSSEALKLALAAMTADLKPVRRLPSDAALVTTGLVVFVLLSIALAFGLGIGGFEALTNAQRWTYYGTLLGCALILSAGLAPLMVPGAKRRVGLTLALAVPFAAVSLCSAVIFPRADLHDFARLGIPCLRAGLICAVATALVLNLLLRRGYIVNPLQTCILAGFFAGFVGVGTLALHCQQQNWIHVMIWHLGAPVVSVGLAFLVWRITNRPRRP